jgi:hypothetical protein
MLIASLTFVVLALGAVVIRVRRRPRSPQDYEASAQATIELRRIGQQLEVDRARAEIRRDVETLREEIEEELL